MAVHVPGGLLLGNAALQALVPAGWLEPQRRANIERISALTSDAVLDREANGWHPGFAAVPVGNVLTHNYLMGYELASRVHQYSAEGAFVDVILPVGPMGQYEYVVQFLNGWNTDLSRVTTYNMDEWADDEGNAVVVGESFQAAMEREFFGKLNSKPQSCFATKDVLPTYTDLMERRSEAARAHGVRRYQILVHGIGQGTHIAFWEAQYAALFPDLDEWLAQTHMLGAPLNPMTIEQNAITSFRSNIFGPQAYANTIGPGIFLKSDYFIGGCDGMLMQDPDEGFSMTWQAQALKMSLAWGSDDPWVPSSWLPRKMPGRLIVLQGLLEPLEAISH